VESGLARDEAYRLVQSKATLAWEEEQDFRELVRGDAEIASRLDLEAVLSLEPYTRHVDTLFERLHALVRTRQEEPSYA
jgi:adenylosuccinate lyase